MKILCKVLCVLVFMFLLNVSFSNIWLDENFDDGAAFNSGDLDTFSYNTLNNPLNLSHDGTLTSSKALNGTYSYQIAAGQSVSVVEPYQDQTNGPYVYLQLGVNLGAIPAATGSMGELRWNWDYDGNGTADYSYYVDFQSTGTAVDIVAGEDMAGSTSGTIGSLTSTSEWEYITLQMQKNHTDEEDPLTSQNLSQGMRFYCSSTTPALEITYTSLDSFNKAKDWSISVTSESLYIDDMYWEGGMTLYTDQNERNLRAFDQGLPAFSGYWKFYE